MPEYVIAIAIWAVMIVLVYLATRRKHGEPSSGNDGAGAGYVNSDEGGWFDGGGDCGDGGGGD